MMHESPFRNGACSFSASLEVGAEVEGLMRCFCYNTSGKV